jgi:hypothetical protein
MARLPVFTRLHARWQLAAARRRGLYEPLAKAAKRYGLPVEYVLAVASRETNLRNMIGDRGHGVGVIQIDIRYHEIARRAKADGSWRTHPTPLIDYGVRMLEMDRSWAQQHWPQFGGDGGRGWLKISASAYNAGRSGAADGVAEGDSDRHTTGDNYGADVLRRMELFRPLVTER